MLAQAAGQGSANNLAGSGYNNKMNSFTTQNNPGTIKAYNSKWSSPPLFGITLKLKDLLITIIIHNYEKLVWHIFN